MTIKSPPPYSPFYFGSPPGFGGKYLPDFPIVRKPSLLESLVDLFITVATHNPEILRTVATTITEIFEPLLKSPKRITRKDRLLPAAKRVTPYVPNALTWHVHACKNKKCRHRWQHFSYQPTTRHEQAEYE